MYCVFVFFYWPDDVTFLYSLSPLQPQSVHSPHSPHSPEMLHHQQHNAVTRKISKGGHLGKPEWPTHQRRPSDDCTDILRKFSNPNDPEFYKANMLPQHQMSFPPQPPPYSSLGHTNYFLSPHLTPNYHNFSHSDSMLDQLGLEQQNAYDTVFSHHSPHSSASNLQVHSSCEELQGMYVRV